MADPYRLLGGAVKVGDRVRVTPGGAVTAAGPHFAVSLEWPGGAVGTLRVRRGGAVVAEAGFRLDGAAAGPPRRTPGKVPAFARLE